MRRSEGLPPERLILLLALATLLFAGALRVFLSGVYYHNLAALGLNATALYALALLAPALFFVPAIRSRPHIVLIAGAIGLALGRALAAPTRGTGLHLPVTAVAAASWLLLLGALAMRIGRAQAAAAGAGIALGWAIDVAFLWYGDSADPTAGLRGLVLLVPTGALLVALAIGAARSPAPGESAPAGSAALAGAALGAWLFVENTILGNPFGAARWNGGEPATYALASLAGLLVGAFLLALRPLPRAWLLALHAAVALALLDHALLHSRALPLLVFAAQVALALDAALILGALASPRGGRALALAGLVALLLHFAYAFTFLYAYVPLTALWKGHAAWIVLLGGLALLAPLARRAAESSARLSRRSAALFAVPLLIGGAALLTPGVAIAEPPATGPFTVMSFNVHQGFANDGTLDPGIFVEVLREQDADLIVLQEADTPRFTSGGLDMVGLLAERAGYHAIYGQPTREQAFGGAILSRFPVREWSVHELPSDSDGRFFTEARIEIAGRDVWVYAVHFTLPRESRLAQLDGLLARADTRAGPKIVAGDFNSCPTGLCPDVRKGDTSDDVYARLAARYTDGWVALGNAANDTAAYTYEAFDPEQRIDYVFTTEEFEVLTYASVRTATALRASDHMPVHAVLQFR